MGFDNTPGSRHRKQDPAAPFVGVDEERMTLEGVQSQRLNEIGGQIFTTKQCSRKATSAFSNPVVFLFKSETALQNKLLKVERATTARLGGKDKMNSYNGRNTAVVSTSTERKEHRHNCVSYYGLLSDFFFHVCF